MSTLFGTFRHSLILLAIVVAVVLTILAGLFMLVAWAAGALALGPIGPVSATVLLLAVVVLLVANFVLLVVLTRCSCRSDRQTHRELESLLPLLFPMVTDLPGVLRELAVALRRTSDGIGWIQDNIRKAGTFLDSAGTIADTFAITVPTVDIEVTEHAATVATPAYKTFAIRGFDSAAQYHPLQGIKDQLSDAGDDLMARTDVNQELTAARTTITAAAHAVGDLANGLGATPPYVP